MPSRRDTRRNETKRNDSKRNDSKPADSSGGRYNTECRSDCCMAWLITIFKVIIILLLTLCIMMIMLDIVNVIKHKDSYTKTLYLVEIIIRIVEIVTYIMLIVMVACEQAGCICITLFLSICLIIWEVYEAQQKKQYDEYVSSAVFIINLLTVILLTCYSILLCFG